MVAADAVQQQQRRAAAGEHIGARDDRARSAVWTCVDGFVRHGGLPAAWGEVVMTVRNSSQQRLTRSGGGAPRGHPACGTTIRPEQVRRAARRRRMDRHRARDQGPLGGDQVDPAVAASAGARPPAGPAAPPRTTARGRRRPAAARRRLPQVADRRRRCRSPSAAARCAAPGGPGAARSALGRRPAFPVPGVRPVPTASGVRACSPSTASRPSSSPAKIIGAPG